MYVHFSCLKERDFFKGDMENRTKEVLNIIKEQLVSKQSVTFDELARGVSKRTAAACFLELLQLKSWDLVDVEQSSPFGQISISSSA
jgi:chromatin segregation and condensation protein Rec8/ScpA/Scc1 (kleisin family)